MNRSSQDIRREFIEFFQQRGHTFVPSSPLLPADDPTLLFANAGMNQFKGIFLGHEKRPYNRAVNSQKCIRAGGKHNDLEDVGHDTYHHTFFEMLGNWSFGDYFKKDAILWAWELLTDNWGLDKRRLHVTVFEGDASEGLTADDEAAGLWKNVTDIDPSQIHLGGKKDNFWEMGETGPCGPCSEIHYDFTPDFSGGPLVNAGDPRVIEIWNLVFIQFNRDESGKLTPLPARHVDTGMGLERIARILQGVDSNYETDIFRGLFEAIARVARTGAYAGSMTDMKDVAYRVVGDHVRSLTFAIADGVIPSNEGRGYVLRRILRRAARYGRQYLDIEGPFLCGLVPTVVELMGAAFPELVNRRDYVARTIRDEEVSFGRTLDRGIDLFQRQLRELRQVRKDHIPGELAFDLYATYGFPVDLTQLMAAEVGFRVDMDGFDAAMARHRELSASDVKFKVADVPTLPATDDSPKYSGAAIRAKVVGWVTDGTFIRQGALSVGDEAGIVLDRTNFYAEQGGQVGDAGHLTWDAGSQAGSVPGRFAVRDTQLAGGGIVHLGVVEAGELHAGQTVTCEVDQSRLDTMRNHTATHLLNWALRRVLGDHVNQAGSVVAPDRLRFDFTHGQAVTPEQLTEAERLVNARVLADEPVETAEMDLAEAKAIPGVRAVFGEKYGEQVRVVAIGGIAEPRQAEQPAVEFCGGTHLERTGRIGLFKIISEESVAKGVRRITAVTGRPAVECVQQLDATVRELSQALRVPPAELYQRVSTMQKELKQARKAKPTGAAGESQLQTVAELAEGRVVILKLAHADAAAMRTACDVERRKGAAAILAGGTDGMKVALVAMVSQALAGSGRLKANEWIRLAAEGVGGAGGGKDTLAQAGGKQPDRLDEALRSAGEWARQKLFPE